MNDAINLNEILLQLPIAAVAIWALITSIRGRNAADVRRAEIEKGQQTLEAKQLKYDDDEKRRRAEMDERWANMYQQLVANNSSLTEAVKGMAVLEQQNQKLLEQIITGQEANAGMIQTNSIALTTLTGGVDTLLTTLAALKDMSAAVLKELNSGSKDHASITQTLEKVAAGIERIEARLTPPTHKPPRTIDFKDIPQETADDGEEQQIAS